MLVDTEGNLVVVIGHAATIRDRGELVAYWESEHRMTIEIVANQAGRRALVMPCTVRSWNAPSPTSGLLAA